MATAQSAAHKAFKGVEDNFTLSYAKDKQRIFRQRCDVT
jgi:hypothetical protein